MSAEDAILLDAEAIGRVLRRIASEIVEQVQGAEGLALVGIRRGGVPLATRLAQEIARVEGAEVPVGTIDIGLYRDDAATALPDPKIGPSHIPFDVDGKHVVLVDDVLQTGRTVRAALTCLLDYGRPKRVWLAVLCDRGGRELPISADFAGPSLEVAPDQRLEAVLDDPPDRVVLRARGEGA